MEVGNSGTQQLQQQMQTQQNSAANASKGAPSQQDTKVQDEAPKLNQNNPSTQSQASSTTEGRIDTHG